jgi:hypothetical protein
MYIALVIERGRHYPNKEEDSGYPPPKKLYSKIVSSSEEICAEKVCVNFSKKDVLN